MSFSLSDFDKLSQAGLTQMINLWGYVSETDDIATIETANYFDDIADRLSIGDYIYLRGSDGSDLVGVTAVSPHVTVAPNPDVVTPGSIVNADINAAAAIDFSKLASLTSGRILVGSAGNVPTAVAMSGDATIVASGALTIANSAITNAKVSASAAIAFSKLAALTDAHILVGSGANVATDVAVSGDLTLANTGAFTLGAVVKGSKVATYAPEDVIPGMTVLHVFNMAGGATATRTIATAQKITVIDAWVVNNGAGTASDTITVKNAGGTAITDAMDISGGDKTIARASSIDDAARVVAASANLQCTETDGGGSDSPACDVYVLCYVTP